MDLIQILITLILLFLGARAEPAQPPVSQPPDSVPGGMRDAIVIEQVEALVMESFPPQIRLNVSGYQPDGCILPIHVDQSRAGNTITVEIYRVLPPDVMCPMVIQPYQDSIPLAGPFDVSTTYTVIVNGVTVEVST